MPERLAQYALALLWQKDQFEAAVITGSLFTQNTIMMSFYLPVLQRLKERRTVTVLTRYWTWEKRQKVNSSLLDLDTIFVFSNTFRFSMLCLDNANIYFKTRHFKTETLQTQERPLDVVNKQEVVPLYGYQPLFVRLHDRYWNKRKIEHLYFHSQQNFLL